MRDGEFERDHIWPAFLDSVMPVSSVCNANEGNYPD
jgi:hypothetical protein